MCVCCVAIGTTNGYCMALGEEKKNREKNGGRTGIDESAMSLDKSKYDIGTHTQQIQDVSESHVRQQRKLYNRRDEFV